MRQNQNLRFRVNRRVLKFDSRGHAECVVVGGWMLVDVGWIPSRLTHCQTLRPKVRVHLGATSRIIQYTYRGGIPILYLGHPLLAFLARGRAL